MLLRISLYQTSIYLSSIYLSGLVTAVAVFRNPSTIPFCLILYAFRGLVFGFF